MIWYISTAALVATINITLFVWFRSGPNCTKWQAFRHSLIGTTLIIILFIGMSDIGERDIKARTNMVDIKMSAQDEITVYLELVEHNGAYEVDAILNDGKRKEVVPLTSYERAMKLGKQSAHTIGVNLRDMTKKGKS